MLNEDVQACLLYARTVIEGGDFYATPHNEHINDPWMDSAPQLAYRLLHTTVLRHRWKHDDVTLGVVPPRTGLSAAA